MHGNGMSKCTNEPANLKETVRLSIRLLNKDIKIPLSMKLTRLSSRVMSEAKLNLPLGCAVVVLRTNSAGVTFNKGTYSQQILEWRVWEAGLEDGDIIHVVEPLPQDWILSEDNEANVFYYNTLTGKKSTMRPTN